MSDGFVLNRFGGGVYLIIDFIYISTCQIAICIELSTSGFSLVE